MEMTYKWQQACLDKWEQRGCRGIVQAVTGAGKTVLALQAVERLREKTQEFLHVFVVVPTNALSQQWNRIFRERLLEWKTTKNFRYEVYVINSARYRLARMILRTLREGNKVFLIADECHRYTGRENRKIFEFKSYLTESPGVYCALGLSATVHSSEKLGILEEALGKIFFNYSYEQALNDGVLAEFELVQIALSLDIDEKGQYEEYTEEMKLVRSRLFAIYPYLGEPGAPFFPLLQEFAKEEGGIGSSLARRYLFLAYKRKRLVCMAKERIPCVLHLLRSLDIQRKIIIFGESIDQADMLYRELKKEYGDRVGRYHSKAGEQANRNALYRFRSGDCLILITCKALDEGVDVPDAGIGIVLSGTGVERQRMQRLGRILRKSKDKEVASLYYLYVRESSEEKGYFPKASELFRVENLEYCSTGSFISV